MPETKLLPCPFCGGKAEIVKNICAVYIRCKDCKSTTAAFTAMIETCALNDAVEAWNRRVNTKDEAWECQGNIGG